MDSYIKPRYRPGLNEDLGGSILLAREYLFPVELPAEKVQQILEEQAGEGCVVDDTSLPYFSFRVDPRDRYDLLYSHGKSEPVDAIAIYNQKDDEIKEFYEVEELTEQ